MRCSRCGKEIPNDSVFCPECGAEQTTEEKPEEIEKQNFPLPHKDFMPETIEEKLIC